MNEFHIRCAVSKYKSKPIKLMVDKVAVELMEPEEMVVSDRVPLPDRGKYKADDRIGDGLTVEIKQLRVVIKTRGLYKQAPMGGPWTPPVMRMDFRDVSFFATDSRWQRYQSLTRIWKSTNHKQTEVMVYRCVTLGSVKVTLERPAGAAAEEAFEDIAVGGLKDARQSSSDSPEAAATVGGTTGKGGANDLREQSSIAIGAHEGGAVRGEDVLDTENKERQRRDSADAPMLHEPIVLLDQAPAPFEFRWTRRLWRANARLLADQIEVKVFDDIDISLGGDIIHTLIGISQAFLRPPDRVLSATSADRASVRSKAAAGRENSSIMSEEQLAAISGRGFDDGDSEDDEEDEDDEDDDDDDEDDDEDDLEEDDATAGSGSRDKRDADYVGRGSTAVSEISSSNMQSNANQPKIKKRLSSRTFSSMTGMFKRSSRSNDKGTKTEFAPEVLEQVEASAAKAAAASTILPQHQGNTGTASSTPSTATLSSPLSASSGALGRAGGCGGEEVRPRVVVLVDMRKFVFRLAEESLVMGQAGAGKSDALKGRNVASASCRIPSKGTGIGYIFELKHFIGEYILPESVHEQIAYQLRAENLSVFTLDPSTGTPMHQLVGSLSEEHVVDANALQSAIFPPMAPRCVSRGGKKEAEHGFFYRTSEPSPGNVSSRNRYDSVSAGRHTSFGGSASMDFTDGSSHSTAGSLDGTSAHGGSLQLGGANRTGLRMQLLAHSEHQAFPMVGASLNVYVAPLAVSVDDAADWVRLPEFFQGCFDRRWINGQVRSISFLVGSFSNASSVFCFFFILHARTHDAHAYQIHERLPQNCS
jgi:hypothetical protein